MAEEDNINLLLAWTDHQEVLTRVMSTLRHKELFADVTLICGEKHYAVHKFVLCTSSPYFEKLLESAPCDHPVLILTETPHEAVEALLDFMYLGKVDLNPDDFDELLDVAYEFKIRGLISPKDDPERQAVREAIERREEDLNPVVKESSAVPVTDKAPTQAVREATEKRKEDLNPVVKESSVVAVTDKAPTQDVKTATEQEQQAVNCDVEESSSVDVPEDTPSQSNEEKTGKCRKVSSTSLISEQESFSGTFERHVCKECHQNFHNLELFGSHTLPHLESKFLSCPECPYRTLSKAVLSKHIEKHVKGKVYACPYCPARHSLEQQHITHQKQVHPKMKVIINESASVGLRTADHRKHVISDKLSQEGLISSPPSKVRRCSRPISSPVHENLRISPSPSPTAKVLNSPKSSASSSPSSEVHEFAITSPSPPPDLPRITRSSFSSSPPSKGQRISGVILSTSPTQNLAKKSRPRTSSPQTRGRVCESSLSPSPPPKLPRNTRSSSISSPPSKYLKTRLMCISPSSPVESSRSRSTSSSSSNRSPDYSSTPSPTPPKSLRTTRSSTMAKSLRRQSREK